MVAAPFLIFPNATVFAGIGSSRILSVRLAEVSPMSRAELDKIKREFEALPEQRKTEWRRTLSMPIMSTDYVRPSDEGPSKPKLSRTMSKKVMDLTGSTRDPVSCPVLTACSELKKRIVKLIRSEITPKQQLSIAIELCMFFGYTEMIESNPEIVKKINSGSIKNVSAYINAANGLLQIECDFPGQEVPFTISI